MQATDLKVRVGFLFDEKSLNAISKRLQRSGEQLSRIGTDLTLSLSAPLAAFGAASIKAAGDIESLTLALKSQLGSSEAAAAELDKLTEAAKNPGLGVEQAVRGSVRLQGVGLAADEARETLIQMGNAIAATGGSAQELDNVTRQFAQMISKGRVLQEDVSILSENMPGLAQLMQKAFGTQSVEAIREMGISGKEFVKRITEAAKELPRVEGGIKNGIGNAMDSLKQSAAKVGFAINNAFDVTGIIESVTESLLSLVNGFASLSSGTQKAILALGGILIAAGPVVKVFGAVKELGSFVVSAWGGLVTASKALVGWLGTLRTAFLALNAATQAFILIGIAVALYQAADAMGLFEKQLTNTEKAQQAVNSVVNAATASVEDERAKVGLLVGVLEDNNRTIEEKKKALTGLKQINSKYFGDLDIENGKVKGLTEATNKYIDSLVRAAVVKKATEEIATLRTELNNLSEAAEPTIWQKAGNALKALVTAPAYVEERFETLNIQTAAFNAIDLKDSIEKKIKALEDLANKNLDLTEVVKTGGNVINDFGGNLDDAKGKAKAFADVINEINQEVAKAKIFGENEDIAKVDALRKGIEDLIEKGLSPASKEVQALKAEFDKLTQRPEDIETSLIPALAVPTSVGSNTPAPGLPAVPNFNTLGDEAPLILENLSNGFRKFAESIGLSNSALIGLNEGMEVIAAGAGPAFEELASSALGVSGAYTRMGAAALSAASKLVKAALAATLAKAIQNSFEKSGNPLLGIALSGIAVGAINVLFGRISQSLSKVPTFARGTGFAPGGMALVGEQGPELINLPRGSQVFSNPKTNRMLENMGGGISVGGEFTVRGTDLVLVLERTQNKNQRFR